MSSIKFIELQLRNFCAFGNNLTTIDLSKTGSTFLEGQNLDSGKSMGSGKSTIINGICYALYNTPFDNIKLEKLINWTNSAKNTLMEVRLIFLKGDDEYEIYRSRGESFTIKVIKNGVNIAPDSVAESDKLIQEIIGLSFEMFTKVVIFSGVSTPFLQLPVSQQRNHVEELFVISALSERAIKLKEQIKQTENDINVQQAVIKEQENQRASHTAQVIAAEERLNRWEAERISQAERLTESLERFSGVDIATEKRLHEQIDLICKEEAALNTKVANLKSTLSTTSKELNKAVSEHAHLVDEKCPYCLQSFVGAEIKIHDLQNSITTLAVSKKQIEHDLSITLEEQKTLQNQRIEISAGVKYQTFAKAIKAEAEASAAQEKIEELLNAVNPHIEVLEHLNSLKLNDVSYDDINELKKLLAHQQFLLKLLTDKNSFVRRRIISRTIPFLNERLSSYTKMLELPHVVKFDDNMGCTITQHGNELDFGNLSGGERKRASLALSLAFRDTYEHLHGSINLLFLDEIDGSLDETGVRAMFHCLKKKSSDDNLAMWVISHRPEAVGQFDRTVIVRKQFGFSQFLEDAD